MGILSGNPKHEPLHYGEVFDIWSASTAAKGCISSYRLLKNHCGDKDLRKILDDVIDQAELEASELDTILIKNGIVPSPTFPDRPKANVEDIPAGARFTDQEIAPMVSVDIAAGLVACSQTIGKSVREDLAALFKKYHDAKAATGLKILRLSKEKGWLIPPPLVLNKPETVEVNA
ncbi:DUF3231 family protein [Paenibacillus sp. MWE-103]|uniref:DUF3231 family protein n=1 Tax=Paenibacillus artemisiicola TaxID=1172618 RepID=A0ABS3W5W3_9BACL|nr:DUF3231 family protein [Paenibacillus artemisiicola]MBO7743684.1 DUF3231 family protein [Paenibacillus artemisiicola]